MENYQIILASSSPRRIEILKKNGIYPIVKPPSVDESLPSNIAPKDAVMMLALKKASYIESTIEAEYFDRPSLIIGADTIVFLDRIIGKPKNEQDAYDILRYLRGKEHFVSTGVAVLKAGTNQRKIFCDTTRVFFKNYSDREIRDYIKTEEPYDKAGGYAIQGAWGDRVDHIIGDFDNVMGFPWARIKQELDRF